MLLDETDSEGLTVNAIVTFKIMNRRVKHRVTTKLEDIGVMAEAALRFALKKNAQKRIVIRRRSRISPSASRMGGGARKKGHDGKNMSHNATDVQLFACSICPSCLLYYSS